MNIVRIQFFGTNSKEPCRKAVASLQRGDRAGKFRRYRIVAAELSGSVPHLNIQQSILSF
jgi:hypothetical protein